MSLVTNKRTAIDVFPAKQLAEHPSSGAKLSYRSDPAGLSRSRSAQEEEYIAWLYRTMDERFPTLLPTQEAFEVMRMHSGNVKDKFSELKDIQDGYFYDFIVQVAKDPYEDANRVSLWVTDYTENPKFYNHQWAGPAGNQTKCGDEFGYTTRYVKADTAKTDWPGPYGRRTLQISCWDSHASLLMQMAKRGTWLRLRNIQVKYGRNDANLEGFLREDENAYVKKVSVEAIDMSPGAFDDPENVDPRLMAALRRKRDYERARKAQIKQVRQEVAGQKRPAPPQDAPPQGDKTNKKQKSKAEMKRALRRLEMQPNQGSNQGSNQASNQGFNTKGTET